MITGTYTGRAFCGVQKPSDFLYIGATDEVIKGCGEDGRDKIGEILACPLFDQTTIKLLLEADLGLEFLEQDVR